MKERIYIAGKITGDPDYQAKFAHAARVIEILGHIPVSPAVLPPVGFSWESYINMTTAMLDECDSVCLLPDWRESRGAMYEYGRAVATGKAVYMFDEMVIREG
jgi:nucleoside 2-deoxyribosyltransferase